MSETLHASKHVLFFYPKPISSLIGPKVYLIYKVTLGDYTINRYNLNLTKCIFSFDEGFLGKINILVSSKYIENKYIFQAVQTEFKDLYACDCLRFNYISQINVCHIIPHIGQRDTSIYTLTEI